MKPYFDIKYSKNKFFRIFFPWIKEDELVWHRDRLDRNVHAIFNVGWNFQFDNELPFLLKDSIFIKSGVYHRIIKGKMPLLIKIEEINE